VHRRDYVHAHVDALVINLEVIRSSAWARRRPLGGASAASLDRLGRADGRSAEARVPLASMCGNAHSRIKNAHGIELRTARRGRFSGHIRAVRETHAGHGQTVAFDANTRLLTRSATSRHLCASGRRRLHC